MVLHGQVVVAGIAAETITVSPFDRVARGISLHGSLAGTAIETEDALAFGALQDIRAGIEIAPLAQAREA